MPKVASRKKSKAIDRPGKSTIRKQDVQRLDLKHFQQLLVDERARLIRERDRIRSRAQQLEGALPTDENWEADEDSGDIAASMLEKEIDMSLEGSFEEMIELVDNALLKIKDKSYGVCDMCGVHIHPLRLERIPFANLCVSCQALVEES